MEKILFATDFSPCANNAFKYVLSSCKFTKAKVDIITVSNTINSTAAIVKEEAQKKFDLTIEENKDIINEYNIIYEFFNEVGPKLEAIYEHIDNHDPDMLFIGSRGNNEILGSPDLLGATTKQLIATSKIPIISVPTHIKFEPVANVVFITNRLQADYFAIIQLLKFASIYNTRVIIAHIHDNQGEAEENFVSFFKDLSELLNYDNFEFRYLEKENYINGINKLIKEYNAQILSLVYEKQTFFERLLNKDYVSQLLINDYIPLLTLPE